MAKENKQSSVSAGCGDLTNDVQNNGSPIASRAAKGYVANFLNGVHDPKHKDHDFGYLFGLNNVIDFMKKIQTYNTGKAPDVQIAGVRVYVGRNAPIKAGALVPMEKVMDTLFLMPVLANGDDLYKVHEFADPQIILGNPRPCPNECLLLSFLSV